MLTGSTIQCTVAQDVLLDLGPSNTQIQQEPPVDWTVASYTPTPFTEPTPTTNRVVVKRPSSAAGLLDNVFFFGGANAFANKGDDNNPNNFGANGGLNLSLPTGLSDLRYQLGFSSGVYDWMGRENAFGTGDKARSAETAHYFTAGVYRRSDVLSNKPWSFGVVFDHFMGVNWGEEDSGINLTQVRYQLGYALGDNDEIGVWGTHRLDEDLFSVNGVDIAPVQAQRQTNLYCSHRWWNGAVSTAYAGLADEPGDWLVGTRMINPISCRLATYANFHYVRPSTSVGDGGVNQYAEAAYSLGFGVMINFGGRLKSRSISGRKEMPFMAVADQGIFGLSIPTGNL